MVQTRDVALVTGGAGFLGSHICDRLLAQDFDVYVIDNLMTGRRENLPQGVALIEDDVINFQGVALERLVEKVRGKLRYVFNFACPASPPKYQADPIHTMLTSVVGAKNMLELARMTNARFVQASTSEVYGDPEVHPQVESYRGSVNTCGPRACYDEGKRAAEALCYDYWRKHGVAVRVVRIFNTYGPRMDPNDGRVVTNFINQALRGEKLTVYGKGNQTRSFCYVDDLIDGIMALAASGGAPGTFFSAPLPMNIGNPDEFEMLELACEVLHLVRGRKRMIDAELANWIDFKPLPQDDPCRRKPNIEFAKSLGWAPKVSLAAGLERTVEYFRKRRQ